MNGQPLLRDKHNTIKPPSLVQGNKKDVSEACKKNKEDCTTDELPLPDKLVKPLFIEGGKDYHDFKPKSKVIPADWKRDEAEKKLDAEAEAKAKA